MKYDANVDKIRGWIDYKKDVTMSTMMREIPPGWAKCADIAMWQVLRARETISTITSFEIRKGLLYVNISSDCGELETEVNAAVVTLITRKSATCCLVCGKRGYRPKTVEVGVPSLCQNHFIQYINYEDDLLQENDHGVSGKSPDDGLSDF